MAKEYKNIAERAINIIDYKHRFKKVYGYIKSDNAYTDKELMAIKKVSGLQRGFNRNKKREESPRGLKVPFFHINWDIIKTEKDLNKCKLHLKSSILSNYYEPGSIDENSINDIKILKPSDLNSAHALFSTIIIEFSDNSIATFINTADRKFIRKSLTPVSLGLSSGNLRILEDSRNIKNLHRVISGSSIKSISTFRSLVKSNIKALYQNTLSDADLEPLIMAFDSIVSLKSIDDYSSKLSNLNSEVYSIDFSDIISKNLHSKDLSVLLHDFGEILTGAFLLHNIAPINGGLQYPAKGNYPFIDLFYNGTGVCIKSMSGSSSSIKSIANKYYKGVSSYKDKNPENSLLISILDIVCGSDDIFNTYFEISKWIQSKGHQLKSIQSILSCPKMPYMLYKDIELGTPVKSEFISFWESLSIKEKKNILGDLRSITPKIKFNYNEPGSILYVIMKECVDFLNTYKDGQLLKDLKLLFKNIDVKYIHLLLNKDILEIHVKDISSISMKLEVGSTQNTPFSKGLSIRFKNTINDENV